MTNEPITTLVNGLSELDAEADRRANYRITRYFPETGPCRRDLYPKHLQFFAAGATHRIRAFLAGNRVGKSAAGAFETTLHLTGEYPAWWEGRRFEEAVHVWAAGDTAKTVRDILQAQLLGRPGAPGTGMIPAHLVDRRMRWRPPGCAIDPAARQWSRSRATTSAGKRSRGPRSTSSGSTRSRPKTSSRNRSCGRPRRPSSRVGW